MPTTANFSLEYPDDNSSVDIAGHFETLADDVDAAINTRLALTGGTLTGALAGTLTTDASSSTTGAFKTAGGMGIAKALYVGTTLNVTGTTTLTGTLNGKVVNDLVTGPASATDNALVRFDNTTGKVVQNSGITVDDSGQVTSDLTISKANAAVRMNASSGAADFYLDTTSGNAASLRFRTGTSLRWIVSKDSSAESSTATGSDLYVSGYNNSGSLIGSYLQVQRSTGRFTIYNTGAGAGLRLGSGGPEIMSGTGSPEGVVTAPVGSRWVRTDGDTLGDFEYQKRSGTGNTGWVVEYGDTGRRDIASSHAPSSNSWGCSSHVIRRVGPTVYYYLTLTNSGGSTVTGATTGISLPAEFRPPATIHFPAIASSGATKESYVWDSGAVWVYGYAGVTTVDLSLTWMTTAAWPSSLPGSAA